jgi:hypothetical protein
MVRIVAQVHGIFISMGQLQGFYAIAWSIPICQDSDMIYTFLLGLPGVVTSELAKI